MNDHPSIPCTSRVVAYLNAIHCVPTASVLEDPDDFWWMYQFYWNRGLSRAQCLEFADWVRISFRFARCWVSLFVEHANEGLDTKCILCRNHYTNDFGTDLS